MIRLVSEILRREGLKGDETKIIKESVDNFIYQVDEQYIVRLRGGSEGYERLKFKADLLNEIRGELPVAEAVAFGHYGKITYLIQKYVKGEPLFLIWQRLAFQQKESLVKSLADYLRRFYSHPAPKFGIPYNPSNQFDSWREYCEDVFNSNLEGVIKLKGDMPLPILDTVIDYFDQNKHALDGSEASIVHGDLWPANILVDKGEIAGIIDFEFSFWGAKDYDFFLTLQFCLFPNDGLEGISRYVPEDFRDYYHLIIQYFPEIFFQKNIRERLNLYLIIHNLRLYRIHLEATERRIFTHFTVDPLLKILIFLFDREAQLYFR